LVIWYAYFIFCIVMMQVYLASIDPDFSTYANFRISGLVKPFLC
jgi:hypothetical protein